MSRDAEGSFFFRIPHFVLEMFAGWICFAVAQWFRLNPTSVKHFRLFADIRSQNCVSVWMLNRLICDQKN